MSFSRLKRLKRPSVPTEVGREDEFESPPPILASSKGDDDDEIYLDKADRASESSTLSESMVDRQQKPPSKQAQPFDPSVFRMIVMKKSRKRPLKFTNDKDEDEEEDHSLDSGKSNNADDDDEENSMNDFIIQDDDDDEENLAAMLEREEAIRQLKAIHRSVVVADPKQAFFVNIEYCARALLDSHFQTRTENNHLSEDHQKYYADSAVRMWYQALDRCESFMESTVWSEEFSLVIDGYPFICVIPTERSGVSSCQVCRRRNHPPRYQIVFYGQTYNPDATLECTESLSKREKQSRECYALELDDIPLSKQRMMYVGENCAERVRIYHAMRHWTVSILLQLRDQLNTTRGLCKARLKELMENRRDFIESLYERYKELIDRADEFRAGGGRWTSAKDRVD